MICFSRGWLSVRSESHRLWDLNNHEEGRTGYDFSSLLKDKASEEKKKDLTGNGLSLLFQSNTKKKYAKTDGYITFVIMAIVKAEAELSNHLCCWMNEWGEKRRNIRRRRREVEKEIAVCLRMSLLDHSYLVERAGWNQ